MRPLIHRPLLAIAVSALLCSVGCAGDDASTSASEGDSDPSGSDATTDGSDTDTAGTDTDTSAGTDTDAVTTGGVVYDGEPLPPGEPGEWVWVDFPEATCRTGTPTGIGVRYGTSDNLLIYLQGGGACFNTLTCLNNPGSYDIGDFTAWSGSWGRWGLFNQDRPENPVGDWNVVYIPYAAQTV